jgi:6-phosphogluconolactonase/glucosamine-6-phosphate isomerase/deaminase
LAGGSAIAVAVDTAKHIKIQPGSQLVVSLIDERYGVVGHDDSNWKQLMDSGFSLPGATLVPVLSGESFDATVANFADSLKNELSDADYSLVLLGIGPDGHTSGILPHSPAVEAKGLTFGYEWEQYMRITTTQHAIALLDEIVVYALGKNKWPVIDNLAKDLPVAEQPAQLLKPLRKVTVFNDREGEPS